jgi:hypothetical protein
MINFERERVEEGFQRKTKNILTSPQEPKADRATCADILDATETPSQASPIQVEDGKLPQCEEQSQEGTK